jgi:hypothetical protein
MADSSMMLAKGGVTKFGYRPDAIPMTKALTDPTFYLNISKQSKYGDYAVMSVERSTGGFRDFTLKEYLNGTLLSWVTESSATAHGYLKALYDLSGNGNEYNTTGIGVSVYGHKIVDTGALVLTPENLLAFQTTSNSMLKGINNPLNGHATLYASFSMSLKISIDAIVTGKYLVLMGNVPYYPGGVGIVTTPFGAAGIEAAFLAGPYRMAASFNVTAGSTNVLTWTFDGSDLRAYTNGVLQTTTNKSAIGGGTLSASETMSTINSCVDYRNSPRGPFGIASKMIEISVFKYALTDSEIQRLAHS